jgi:excisionase family DNA binding protein
MSEQNLLRRFGDTVLFKSEAAELSVEILNQKKILTVDEAAQYLNISKDTVYSMAHFPDKSEGTLPHFHFGKVIRFYRDLLDLWIIKNSSGLDSKLLIDFQKAYLNNVGRKEVETTKNEVSHG